VRLLLWDIDGTLIRAGPVAREAFANAVGHVLGAHPGETGLAMSGKTDPQIARELLTLLRVPRDRVDAHLPSVLEHLQEEVAGAIETMRSGGRLLPGAREVLARCAAAPDVVQTVLTGNIAANAAAKLSAFDLHDALDLSVGAFGSDHHDRSALVPVALARVRQRFGATPRTVWVIGDTPNDLACARAGGARCLLVGSGRIPYDELRHLGADAALPDLSDVDGVCALLLGAGR
jgi:phosphoglycolate phosphatase